MSDEQTEQELDAAVIANYRAWCAEFDTIEAADWSFALDLRLEELRVLLGDGSDTFADSAIRTIDRLTAERDAARAEVERLRAERDSVALAWAYLMRYSWNVSEPDRYVMRAEGILVGLNLPIVELPETEADHD